MAKRRTIRKVEDFVTKYPDHHVVVDAKSRSLIGKGYSAYKPPMERSTWTGGLVRLANKLLGEVLIENQPEVHTVVDDRVPVEQLSLHSGLRPTWHGTLYSPLQDRLPSYYR